MRSSIKRGGYDVDCEECRSIFFEFITDEITDADKRDVVSHLKICEKCREDLQNTKRVFSDFQELPMMEVPSGFHEELMSKIEIEAEKLPPIKKETANKGKQLRMATVAAVFLVAVGVIASGDGDVPMQQDAGIITATASEEDLKELTNQDILESIESLKEVDFLATPEDINKTDEVSDTSDYEATALSSDYDNVPQAYAMGGSAEEIEENLLENNTNNDINNDGMIMTAEAMPMDAVGMNAGAMARSMPEPYEMTEDVSAMLQQPMMANEPVTGAIVEIDNDVDDILYVFARENAKKETMDQFIDAIDNFDSVNQITQTIYGSEIVVAVSAEDYNNVMDLIKSVNKNIEHLVVCNSVDVVDTLFVKIVFE